MKQTITAMLALCLAAGMALPASALEYTIDAPNGPDYGDPTSVEFCHKVGLDYVSCSPYRVPIARLAAAQAAIKNPRN